TAQLCRAAATLAQQRWARANPNGVAAALGRNPVGVGAISRSIPRVAPAAQPLYVAVGRTCDTTLDIRRNGSGLCWRATRRGITGAAREWVLVFGPAPPRFIPLPRMP